MCRTCFQPNKTKNISGMKFNSLTAIRFDHRDDRVKGGQHFWLFRCDCGNEVILRKNSVTSGNTKKCSECYKKEKSKRATTHGYSKTRIYREWAGMIQRCENPKSTSWRRYGEVGISVCNEWHKFESFYAWAITHGYNDSLTIDRINNSEGYNPENCRWVTPEDQASNKKNTIIVRYRNETVPLSVLAKTHGIKYRTIYDRIFKQGLSVDDAVETPICTKKINRLAETGGEGRWLNCRLVITDRLPHPCPSVLATVLIPAHTTRSASSITKNITWAAIFLLA